MPYVSRKTKSARKTYKKPYKRSTRTLDSKIRTIAKQITLRQAETKHTFTNLGSTPVHLTHNNVFRLSTPNMLYTQQGTADGDTSGEVACRVGDSVIPVGVKIYLTVMNEIQYAGAMMRIIIVKTRGALNLTGLPFKNITGQLVADSLDKEATSVASVVYDKIHKFGDASSASRHDNTATHNTHLTSVRKIWIPKNKLCNKYTYAGDNNTFGRDFNLACFAIGYSSWSVPANAQVLAVRFAQEFHFKDL